jgi:4-diphosphocytidyl-2-C-methyl-D-erythritol kinase
MPTAPEGDKTLRVLAPAKINLFLHVGEKRPDGYHELESLVAFADYGDRLVLESAAQTTLALKGPFAGALGATPDNLVLRALRALGSRQARIVLEKNLPLASGLGGGSADAAAALRGVNLLHHLGLDEARLCAIAAELGSDVPACVLSRTLWMTGRGEHVAAVAPLPSFALVLANPGTAVPTSAIFAALNARSGVGKMAPPKTPITSVWELVEYLGDAGNDLEAPACSLVPAIDSVLEALGHEPGCVLAQMCGSGATCFGLFQDGPWAEGAAERLAMDHPDWWVRATHLARPGIGVPADAQ